MRLTSYELEACLEVVQYLDKSGFISESVVTLSSILNLPVDDIAYAISVIQKCEPTGVGARDTQECLQIQLKEIPDAPRMCVRILKEFWGEFEKQDFAKIAKNTKSELEEILNAAKYIKSHLDPRPARQFDCDVNRVLVAASTAFYFLTCSLFRKQIKLQ